MNNLTLRERLDTALFPIERPDFFENAPEYYDIIEQTVKEWLEATLKHWKGNNLCTHSEFDTVDWAINELTEDLTYPKSLVNNLTCDKSKEPPCHLEPSEKLCGKCGLNKSKTTKEES